MGNEQSSKAHDGGAVERTENKKGHESKPGAAGPQASKDVAVTSENSKETAGPQASKGVSVTSETSKETAGPQVSKDVAVTSETSKEGSSHDPPGFTVKEKGDQYVKEAHPDEHALKTDKIQPPSETQQQSTTGEEVIVSHSDAPIVHEKGHDAADETLPVVESKGSSEPKEGAETQKSASTDLLVVEDKHVDVHVLQHSEEHKQAGSAEHHEPGNKAAVESGLKENVSDDIAEFPENQMPKSTADPNELPIHQENGPNQKSSCIVKNFDEELCADKGFATTVSNDLHPHLRADQSAEVVQKSVNITQAEKGRETEPEGLEQRENGIAEIHTSETVVGNISPQTVASEINKTLSMTIAEKAEEKLNELINIKSEKDNQESNELMEAKSEKDREDSNGLIQGESEKNKDPSNELIQAKSESDRIEPNELVNPINEEDKGDSNMLIQTTRENGNVASNGVMKVINEENREKPNELILTQSKRDQVESKGSMKAIDEKDEEESNGVTKVNIEKHKEELVPSMITNHSILLDSELAQKSEKEDLQNGKPNDGKVETVEFQMNHSLSEDLQDDDLFTLSRETMLDTPMGLIKDSDSSILTTNSFEDDQKLKEPKSTEIKVIEESVTFLRTVAGSAETDVTFMPSSPESYIAHQKKRHFNLEDGEKVSSFTKPVASCERDNQEKMMQKLEYLNIGKLPQSKPADSKDSRSFTEYVPSQHSYTHFVAKEGLVPAQAKSEDQDTLRTPKPEAWNEENVEDLKKPLISQGNKIMEADRLSNFGTDTDKPKASMESNPDSIKTPLVSLLNKDDAAKADDQDGSTKSSQGKKSAARRKSSKNLFCCGSTQTLD